VSKTKLWEINTGEKLSHAFRTDIPIEMSNLASFCLLKYCSNSVSAENSLRAMESRSSVNQSTD
jgi:hypothetical protein